MRKEYKFLIILYFFVYLFFSFETDLILNNLFMLLLTILIFGINIFIISYKKLSTEKKFGIVAGLLGIILIFLIPILHGIDEGAHFYKVYSFFSDISVPEELKSNLEDAVPKAIIDANSVRSLQDTLALKNVKIDESQTLYTKDYIGAKLYSPISYLTYLLPMFVFKTLLNADIYWIVIAGRIFSFIIWLLVSMYTIKLIPKRKDFIAFLCLMPISLTIVTTFTGDLLTNATAFLFIAIWYKLYEEKRPIKLSEFLLITLLGILSCFAKIVYALIFLIMFLLPKECFKNITQKNIYCFILTLILVFTCIFNLSFVGTDLLEYYPLIENQKEYIFNHPFDYLLTFIRTITKNFGYYIYQFTTGKTTICHNTISVDDTISFIYFIALIASLFFEESEIKLSKKSKFLIFTIIFLVIFIIHTSLYVQWTANNENEGIGNKLVIGVQGRYFIPIAVLSIFINSKKSIKVNKNDLWSLVILINFGILLKICTRFLF